MKTGFLQNTCYNPDITLLSKYLNTILKEKYWSTIYCPSGEHDLFYLKSSLEKSLLLFSEDYHGMSCSFASVCSFTDWCVSEHIPDTRSLVHAPFIYLFTRHVWPSMSSSQDDVTEFVLYTPLSVKVM